ncbi:MAG TPA: sigma-70 family RNA polymerase sigma factor [Pirellulaceae bacterium]|nr:sigma-70 family RNA polymerase sigma factor [Pirellulaceae bacterium]
MSPTSDERDDRFGFGSTRWSRVLATGEADEGRRDVAFEELCARYWSPVYAFIRRLGHDPHDAQDLTQAFFAQVLQRQAFARADPTRGRFRTYLKTLVRHFLSDEHGRRNALRRGGGLTFVSLDVSSAETRLADPTTDDSPDARFEREWALQVVESALTTLESEARDKGRSDQWEVLRSYLSMESEPPSYPETAARLGMTVTALKVAVHRLRQRFRELLRSTIADTLEDRSEVDDELAQLIQALRRP